MAAMIFEQVNYPWTMYGYERVVIPCGFEYWRAFTLTPPVVPR